MRSILLALLTTGCGAPAHTVITPPKVVATIPLDAGAPDVATEDAEPVWAASCSSVAGPDFANGTTELETCDVERERHGPDFTEYVVQATLIFHPPGGGEALRADLGTGGRGSEYGSTSWSLRGIVSSKKHTALLAQRDSKLMAIEYDGSQLTVTEIVDGSTQLEVEVAKGGSYATLVASTCTPMGGPICTPGPYDPHQTLDLRWKGDKLTTTMTQPNQ